MRQNSSGVLSTETLCRLIRQIVVKHISRILLGFFKSPELLQFHTVPRLINYQQIIIKLEIIQTYLLVINMHFLNYCSLFYYLFSRIYILEHFSIYTYLSHIYFFYIISMFSHYKHISGTINILE